MIPFSVQIFGKFPGGAPCLGERPEVTGTVREVRKQGGDEGDRKGRKREGGNEETERREGKK